VQRLWCDEGATAADQAEAQAAQGCPASWSRPVPNEAWAIDFVSDRTADGQPIKTLSVSDEHTREALATPTARRIGADATA
jgi:putative transposase